MEQDIRELLEEEIRLELEQMSYLTSGSQEKSRSVDDFSTMYKLLLESEDLKQKAMLEDEKANEEYRYKTKQLTEQKKDRVISYALRGIELAVPVIFGGIWMKRGLQFEQEHTYTSQTFRNLWNGFKIKIFK